MAVHVRFFGKRGVFTSPHLSTDPCSEPYPSVSAIPRMLSSIYGHPQFEWEVEAIFMHNPPKFDTYKSTSLLRDTGGPSLGAGPGGNRALQTYTILLDLDFTVRARVAVNTHYPSDGRNRDARSYEEEALRRMREGQQFRELYFGRSEFVANWELATEIRPTIQTTADLGRQLFGLIPLDLDNDKFQQVYRPFRIDQGAIFVPERYYAEFRDRVFRERARAANQHAKKKGGRRVEATA